MSELRSRRRQARGERRIEQVLGAAARVFAEEGYEGATTNAIAASAGISPGSLYQFFQNKEAIAEALASRYVTELQLALDTAFSADLGQVPIDELLDRIVDPMISFNLKNPGFQALFADPGVPKRLAKSTQRLHNAVLNRLEDLLAVRAPHVPRSQRARTAQIMVSIFRALMPLVLSTNMRGRAAVIGELKKVLGGYLSPLIGQATLHQPAR